MATDTQSTPGGISRTNVRSLTTELGPPPDTLNNGDRLTQPEFHALYEKMPENVHAELIGGIVYMASPLRARHGSNHSWLTTPFVHYEWATPGTQVCDNSTIILGKASEPQPDLLLRVLPSHGGRTETDADGYVVGPPELVVEVSDSSRSLDLGMKRREYAGAGVLEYLVLNLRDQRLHWFDLAADREFVPDADGVYRVRVFPGLWIDAAALFARDLRRLLTTLDAGLATPEHAAFAAALAAAKTA